MTEAVLGLVDRIRNHEITLDAAVGEAIGAASVCWTDHFQEFDSERAQAIVQELQEAIYWAIEIAINQQSIDTLANKPDWELGELIFQAPIMGFEEEN
jgi:hypothetical protein